MDNETKLIKEFSEVYKDRISELKKSGLVEQARKMSEQRNSVMQKILNRKTDLDLNKITKVPGLKSLPVIGAIAGALSAAKSGDILAATPFGESESAGPIPGSEEFLFERGKLSESQKRRYLQMQREIEQKYKAPK